MVFGRKKGLMEGETRKLSLVQGSTCGAYVHTVDGQVWQKVDKQAIRLASQLAH